ncbi:equilibrative nucleoside transporter 1 [Stylonychia lemnae]|uniref:Equilibrative nucleoside transporter 1 n=1 Tax=Stylonychia lemnae TaxID=5949 RepID=A0A078ANC7_STYLE|nr:equilibrative nucleoside transporter 1 [Stylonychia lemnae]|eukprot:CDW83406.1 equilibrative nucleoside transporter 1 [Stylonychia lemnae]
MTKKDDFQFDNETPAYSNEIPLIKEPEDKGNVGYWLMLLFGIGALLPWNAILTALDFFEEKQSRYQPSFVFGFAVNSLLTVVQVIILLYGYKVSYVVRISGGFLVIAVLMIILPLTTNYLGSTSGFFTDIGILVIFGAMGGIVQGSVFGLAGMLPFKYMGAVMFGNGLSGITLNILRAITLAAFPPGVEGSNNNFLGSLVYFILAAIILVIAAIGMVIFMRLPFAQYYVRRATDEKNKTQKRISGTYNDMDEQDKSLLSVTNDINKTGHESDMTPKGDLTKASHQTMSPFMAFLIMVRRSFLMAWEFLTAITSVFFVTFIVFPGTSLHTGLHFMDGIDNASLKGAWSALILITVFNVLDTIGRWLAGQKFGQGSDKFVLILTFVRVIFIATFLLIALNVSPAWLFGVDADWFKLINMILFAFTNGYCSTQCAIKAPSRASDDSKESVGTLIGLFLTLGIFLGSIGAIGMGKIF